MRTKYPLNTFTATIKLSPKAVQSLVDGAQSMLPLTRVVKLSFLGGVLLFVFFRFRT